MKLAAIIAYAKDNVDKATVGLTLVHAALESGHAVRVALEEDRTASGGEGGRLVTNPSHRDAVP